MVFCVYLPPEGSKYALDNEQVLNKLTIELYRHSEADQVFVCGDFNTRIGEMDDNVLAGATSPPQVPLDLTTNLQGTRLINFVNDIKGVVVNGHVTPQRDYFISIACHKGKAVVDYHLCRQTDLSNVTSMAVKSCIELVAEYNLQHLLTDKCHLPDQSLLVMEVETSLCVMEQLCNRNLGSVNVQQTKIRRKVGDSYMETDVAQRLLGEMLEELSSKHSTQAEVNMTYNNLTTLVLSEAEKSVETLRKKKEKDNV